MSADAVCMQGMCHQVPQYTDCLAGKTLVLAVGTTTGTCYPLARMRLSSQSSALQ